MAVGRRDDAASADDPADEDCCCRARRMGTSMPSLPLRDPGAESPVAGVLAPESSGVVTLEGGSASDANIGT